VNREPARRVLAEALGTGVFTGIAPGSIAASVDPTATSAIARTAS
jgi:hypothetical protein